MANNCVSADSLTNGVIADYERPVGPGTSRGVAQQVVTNGLDCARGVIMGVIFQTALFVVGAICWDLVSLLMR